MFGQDGIGTKLVRSLHHAFRHDALSLAEQVRQQARIGDPHVARQIGHDEVDGRVADMGHGSLLDKAADAQPGAEGRGLLGELAGAVEEHDAVAQREEREAGRGSRDAESPADQHQTPAFPPHPDYPSKPSSRANWSRRASC